MPKLDKHELEALQFCITNWARCLPPMGKDPHPNRDIDKAHNKVRLARSVLKRLRTGGVMAADNWQQYAKDGETAQACIERHRREGNALLKLLAQAREPLTDERIIALLPAGWTGMLAQVMEFVRRIEAARGVTPCGEAQTEPEPQLVGYEECRCILTQYCDGTCRPVFALPAVLERARTLYANSPGAYRGTTPLPWDRAPMPTRLEFIGKAKVEVGQEALRNAGVALPETQQGAKNGR